MGVRPHAGQVRRVSRTRTFDAPVDRVWQLWADPRQLEWWWGPPTHPATVVDHDLTPGGRGSYFVTGPDGDRSTGWWQVLAVDPPHRLEFELGGPRTPTLTVHVTVEPPTGGGTRMTIETTFPTGAAMEQLISMAFEDGLLTAIGQIDDVLGAA
jgi:uncharacterized protein YndB with AHSA1/START domain